MLVTYIIVCVVATWPVREQSDYDVNVTTIWQVLYRDIKVSNNAFFTAELQE